MTLTRKLATRIAEFLVRFASPGSKEWAEGILHEIAFLDDDWAALRWTIGGLRILLNRREAPVQSLDEFVTIARKFAERRRNLNHLVLALSQVGMLSIELNTLWRAHNLQQRVGYGLIACGFGIGAVMHFFYWRKLPSIPYEDETEAILRYYKQHLERSIRTGYDNSWWMTPMIACFTIGFALDFKGSVHGHAVWYTVMAPSLLLFFLVYVLAAGLHKRKINQIRLERLNELLNRR